MDEWVTFTGKGTKRYVRERNAPYLTIHPKGSVTLNYTALRMLGEPEYVQLAIHPRLRKIGIRAANAETPGRYKLNISGPPTQRRAVFGPKAFLSYINYLYFGQGHTFHLEQEEDMLVAVLADDYQEVGES